MDSVVKASRIALRAKLSRSEALRGEALQMRRPQYDQLYEALVALYLRLNGYFTTGLILHTERSARNNRGQVDWLALRAPFHDQEARGVPASEFLNLREGLGDILICEVKSSVRPFNRSLQDPASIADVLRWAGTFPESDIDELVRSLTPLLDDDAASEARSAGVVKGNFRVRPLLCYPSRKRADVDGWVLCEDEVMQFLDRCLNPRYAPVACGRRYGYELWGEAFEPIVRWFKRRKDRDPLTVTELFRNL